MPGSGDIAENKRKAPAHLKHISNTQPAERRRGFGAKTQWGRRDGESGGVLLNGREVGGACAKALWWELA